MKKLLLMAIFFTFTIVTANSVISASAYAQAGQSSADQQANDFQKRKGVILKLVSDRIAAMQQRKVCIQDATNLSALARCMPEQTPHSSITDEQQPAQK